jgi:uncharacterized protein YndB with AHSA1/START domain
MPSKNEIKFKRLVSATPVEVYAAFTHATALTEWLCDVAEADARAGGSVYFWWRQGYYASGEFVQLKPVEKIAFSWHGRNEPGITHVQVTFKPKGDSTLVALTHTGIGAGKAWGQTRKEIKRGWKIALENLQSVLETGQDLRVIRRPLLGVSGVEPVPAEQAAGLGLPAHGGLRLTGLVDGLGAQAAGLQKGDVLVKLGGHKVADFEELATALQNFQAGDEIKVVFYRDGEKTSAKMILSPRPVPEVPASPEGLVEALKTAYERDEKALQKVFKKATDVEAAYHPSPDEWSAKEVVAHLVAAERDVLAWIAGLLGGQDPGDIFRGNYPARINAITAAYATTPALLAELKRLRAEITLTLTNLPPELAARKGTYWRLGYTLLNLSHHSLDHVEQIRAALQIARQSANQVAPPEPSDQSDPIN